MPLKSKKARAAKQKWMRWKEFPEERLLELATQKERRRLLEQKESLEFQSIEDEEGETAMSTLYVQEALDTGKAKGETRKACESEECAPPCDDEAWYAPITEDLSATSADEDSDSSRKGSKGTDRRDGLFLHTMEKNGERPGCGKFRQWERLLHICSLCRKPFRTVAKLNAHHQRNHREQKLYSCQECGKRYRSVGGLKGHRLRVHMGEARRHVENYAGN